MKFRVLLLEAAPVPPGGRPAREVFLRDVGGRALAAAVDESRAVIDALNLDDPPAEIVLNNRQVDQPAVSAMRREWNRIRAEADPAQLAGQEGTLRRAIANAKSALNHGGGFFLACVGMSARPT